MKNASGYDTSGANAASLPLLEQACHELRCYIGDPVATVDRALLASPELVMGHALRAYPHLLGTEPAGLPVARRPMPCSKRSAPRKCQGRSTGGAAACNYRKAQPRGSPARSGAVTSRA